MFNIGAFQVTLVKNPSANARDRRDAGSIPGSGRSSGEGNGNPLQYSCLGNLMDRGPWQATHEVSKSQTSAHSCSILEVLLFLVKKKKKGKTAIRSERTQHLPTSLPDPEKDGGKS